MTAAQTVTLDAFGAKLAALGQLWRSQMHRRLKSVDLSYVQYVLLRYLQEHGDGTVQKELAAAVGIDGTAMVGVLDRLANRGLIERREAAHDRRFKTVHLTEMARRRLEAAAAQTRGLRQELLSGVAAADLTTCVRVFDAINARACTDAAIDLAADHE